jgi:hypothetical protein
MFSLPHSYNRSWYFADEKGSLLNEQIKKEDVKVFLRVAVRKLHLIKATMFLRRRSNLCLGPFRKYVEKTQARKKSGCRYCTWRGLYIYENISLNSSSNGKWFKVAEKIKIHISCSIIFSHENHDLYGIMWKIW